MQGEQIARDVIAGMSGQPVLLALLVLNLLFAGGALWYLNNLNVRNTELFNVVVKSCL